MPGVWKKTLTYLGLVEDEEFDELDEVAAQPRQADVRSIQRPQAVREVAAEPRSEGVVRTIPSPRPSTASSIHKSEPRRFNEAREIADRYKDGIPVIMNLQSTDDTIARRLVDFASGLVYGLDGKIEMVANRVYLLTPANMEVSAEDRERIAGAGFYNQF
jgi:cell division inhibitor SepF